MHKDPLHDLFTQNPPAPDPARKKQIKAAALEAFRAEWEDFSESGQGIDEPERLTRAPNHARTNPMKLSRYTPWFGGIAACCLLTFGYLHLGPRLPGPTPSIQEAAQPDAAPVATDAEKGPQQENLAAAAPAAPQLELAEVEVAQKAATTNEASVAERRPVSIPSSAAAPIAGNTAESDGYLPPPAEHRDRFTALTENPVQSPLQNPVSTFSIDVDTASYSFVRRQLKRGQLPPKDAVRIEELLNYFDYAYPVPQDRQVPFTTTVAVSDSPWRKGNKLVHIGLRGYDLRERPDSNLVFLLDVSGSMESPDKLPLVIQSLSLLLDSLKPTDRVAIVVYAGAAGTVLEPTQVKEKAKILAALRRLQAGGSTAGAQGLKLAYQLAEQHFDNKAVNRVILATDGDFNVGVTQDERLEDFVRQKKNQGIYLSVLGFGEGNYQDALMQTLAQNGNGVAAYLDTLSEARKVLVDEATSTLFPIANDVKIQVEFNPAMVKEYRLIGYETRALQREDFNNDRVDAGDIGAGHSVTALYEITPMKGAEGLMDDLRYQPGKIPGDAGKTEYGHIKLRYKLPGEQESRLINHTIASAAPSLTDELKRAVDFASAVAGFAQILRGGKYIDNFTLDDVIALAQANKGEDPYGYRGEFIQLVRMAKIAQPM